MILAILGCAAPPDLAPADPLPAWDPPPDPPAVEFRQVGVGYAITADPGERGVLRLRRDDGTESAIPLDRFGRGSWSPDPCVDLDQHELPVELSVDGVTWWAQDLHYAGYLARSAAVTLANGPAAACGMLEVGEASRLAVTGFASEAYDLHVDAPVSVRVAFLGRENLPPVTLAPAEGVTDGHVALVGEGADYEVTLTNESDGPVRYVWSIWRLAMDHPR